MTRTSRHMPEPPIVDPLWSASGTAPPAAPLDPVDGSMVMLCASIIAGAVVSLSLIGGYLVHRHLAGRIDQVRTELRALHTFTPCDAPRQAGDATVITVRSIDTRLAIRCQAVTQPFAPERALRP